MQHTQLPFITAMIVVRNGVRTIGPCLDSFIAQDYPQDRYEILIVDGMSDDGTLEEVEKRRAVFPALRILQNPKQLLAAGWNLGLRTARGDYVVRLDAHAYAYPDFLRRSMEVMLSTPDAGMRGRQYGNAKHQLGGAGHRRGARTPASAWAIRSSAPRKCRNTSIPWHLGCIGAR